jgi:hypothetical protein
MKLLTLCIFLAVTGFTFAQKQISAGLNFTVEERTGGKSAAGFGAACDFKITKHSGLLTGVLRRTYSTKFTIIAGPSNIQRVSGAERRLSLFLLYKFHSKILNFSAGSVFEFFAGLKEYPDNTATPINPFSLGSKFNAGIMGSISKNIRLSKKLIIEPELRLTILAPSGYNILYVFVFPEKLYAGAGIALKYILK